MWYWAPESLVLRWLWKVGWWILFSQTRLRHWRPQLAKLRNWWAGVGRKRFTVTSGWELSQALLKSLMPIAIPNSFMVVILSKLSPGTLRDMVLGARKFSAQMAVESRMVDSVFTDSPQTLEAAVREAHRLVGRGWKKEVYSELRLGVFPGVVEELDAHRYPYYFPVTAKL